MTPTGAAELEDAATETPSPHGPPVVVPPGGEASGSAFARKQAWREDEAGRRSARMSPPRYLATSVDGSSSPRLEGPKTRS